MTAETPRITAVTPLQAAKVLSAAGGRRITEAMLRADIDAGVPVSTRVAASTEGPDDRKGSRLPSGELAL